MRRLLMMLMVTGCLATCGSATGIAGDAPPEARIVRIIVNHRTFDPYMPWRIRSPSTRTGYGVCIDSNLVLTTEHLIRNGNLIELEPPRSIRRSIATLLVGDPMLNLALLQLEEPLTDIPPISITGKTAINAPVDILQFNSERDIETAAARVSRIAVTGLPDTPASSLAYHMLCDLNVNGEGAPVFVDDKLAGLVIAFQQQARIATMIAAPYVSRFIEDARGGDYRGSARAGVRWRPLVTSAKRRYLGLNADQEGILVIDLLPGSPAATALHPLDVLLEWDGFPLDHMGYYQDPEFGRLDFSHLVKGHRSPGETVPVEVWRNGSRTNVVLTLIGSRDTLALVPENITGKRPGYIVSGGVILRELDGHFMKAGGSDWYNKVNARLTQLYLTGLPGEHAPGDRVVIVAGVLPDAINVGYHHIRGVVVNAVNGTPVRGLKDVFRIKQRDGALWRFSLVPAGTEIVLDRDGLDAANARIAEDYQVSALSHAPAD